MFYYEKCRSKNYVIKISQILVIVIKFTLFFEILTFFYDYIFTCFTMRNVVIKKLLNNLHMLKFHYFLSFLIF